MRYINIMSNIHYINTQEIRKNLVGFLKSLENGEEVTVLNRSKVIARLNRPRTLAKASGGVKRMLEIADQIQRASTNKPNALGPTQSYKEQYYKDMAKKYGIS